MTVQRYYSPALAFLPWDGLYGAQVSYIREIVPGPEKIPAWRTGFHPGIINIRSDVVEIIDIRRIIPLGEEQAKEDNSFYS